MSSSAFSTPRTRRELVTQIAALLEVGAAEMGEGDSLLDWGLDSLRLMTLVEQWNAHGASISFADLAEEPTLHGFARALELPE